MFYSLSVINLSYICFALQIYQIFINISQKYSNKYSIAAKLSPLPTTSRLTTKIYY